jgi:signal transduction histidine kinase
MREAARLIGAQLSIDSSPGNGTRVRLRIPKPAGAAA